MTSRSRVGLQLEILALRHQLHVLERSHARRLRLTRFDRLLWVWFSRVWCHWRTALVIVKPETVVGWHRRGFRLFWTWKSRHRPGRPTVLAEIKSLIHTMSETNPLWGAPRVHGELLKLGVHVSQTTVATHMPFGASASIMSLCSVQQDCNDSCIAIARTTNDPELTYR